MNSVARLSRILIGLGSIFALILACSVAVAQPPVEGAGPTRIGFRRVLVPQEELEDLTRGLFTMDRATFERQVAQHQLTDLNQRQESKFPSSKSPELGRIVTARYAAELDGDDLNGIVGRMLITNDSNRRGAIVFEPCSLFIRQAEWEETHQPARLGRDDQGRTVLIVDKSGWLNFQWSMRGRRDEIGDLNFDLALPNCAVKHLKLEAPVTLRPILSSGIAELPVSAAEVADPSDPAGAAASQGRKPGTRSWGLNLGGSNRINLRLVPVAARSSLNSGAFARYANSIGITESGFDLNSRMLVDLTEVAVRQLTLVVDAGVHIATCRWDGRTINPTRIPSDDPARDLYLLEIPVPAVGSNHELTVTAMGSAVLDRDWVVPKLRLREPIWQQEACEVRIPESLVLQRLNVTRGRESRITPLPPPLGGNSHDIQYFGSDSNVTIHVARQVSRLSAKYGFSVGIGPVVTSGVAIADIESQQGEHFELNGTILNGWTVDDVSTEPASALESWQLEVKQNRTQVRLALKTAVTPQRGVRVRISLHRPSRKRTGSDDFRLIELLGANSIERTISVFPEAPFQLRFTGELDARASQLEPNDTSGSRLQISGGGLAYRDSDRISPFSAIWSDEKPVFSAVASIDIKLRNGTAVQDYRIDCDPEQSAVDRVELLFSEKLDDRVDWYIEDANHEILYARRLESDKGKLLGLNEGDEWEVVFRKPKSAPFVLHASRATTWTGPLDVPLLSIPESRRQVGRISVRTSDGSRPLIHSIGLDRSIPIGVEPGEYSSLRAAFRYDPSQRAKLSVSPTIPDEVSTSYQVLHTHARSRIEPNGKLVNSILYRLENSGTPRVVIHLPSGARALQLHVDNLELDRAWLGSSGDITVALPPGKKYPWIQLVYTLNHAPLGLVQGISLELPKLDSRSLTTVHDVWIPPRFQASDCAEREPEFLSHIGSRLLGDLYRPPADSPFPIFDRDAWLRSFFPTVGLTSRDSVASVVIASLAVNPNKSGNTNRGPLTWKSALKNAQTVLKQQFVSAPEILIDSEALAASGITPNSLVELTTEGTYLQRAREMLRRANLAILVRGTTCCMTTKSVAMLYDQDLSPLTIREAWEVRPGPLADELQMAKSLPRTMFVDLATWTSAADALGNWAAIQPMVTFDLPRSGWRGFRILNGQKNVESPQIVTVYSQTALTTIGWAVCLVTYGVLLASWLRRRFVFILIGGLLAGCIYLVPDWLLPIARGALGGLWMAFISEMIGGHTTAEEQALRNRPSKRGLLAASPAVLLLTLLLVTRFWIATSKPLAAEETPSRLPPALADAVVIPVDDSRNPVGEYVFVPKRLYEALLKQDRLSGGDIDWIIQSVDCIGSMEAEPVSGRLGFSQLEMNLAVDVFGPQSTVRIPFGGSDESFVTALLDGQPVLGEWNADKREIAISNITAGTHVVTIAFRPKRTEDAGFAVCNIGLPGLPNTRFELSSIRGGATNTRIESHGAVWRGSELSNSISANVGGAEKATLRWPSESRKQYEDQLEVDELLWVRVMPDSVVLDAKYVLKPFESRIREIVVDAEFGLRLLPSGDGLASIRRQFSHENMQRFVWEPTRPISQETTFLCSFALNGTIGIGNIRLPRIDFRNARIGRRWAAVSLPGDLTFHPLLPVQMISLGDFKAEWGSSESTPQFAFENPQSRAWMFECRPVFQKPTAICETDVTLTADAANLRTTIQLDKLAGPRLQLQMAGFQDVELLSARVMTQTEPRELNWHRSGDEVRVFFDHSPAENSTLVLLARFPYRQGHEFQLPDIRPENMELVEERIRVFRRSDVRAHVARPTRVRPDLGTRGEFDPAKGRLIDSWTRYHDGGRTSDTAQATVWPNNPRANGSMVTSLQYADDRWTCQVTCDITVHEDLVDALRIQLPNSVKESIRIRPAMPFEIRTDPRTAIRDLVIHPTNALEGDFHFQFEADVTYVSGERFSAPIFQPIDLECEQSYQLPTHVESQRVKWETVGMREIAPNTYQTIGPRPAAVAMATDGSEQNPRISLTDGVVVVRDAGTIFGLVTWYLEPERIEECTIQVPADVRLMDVAINGIPVPLERRPGASCRVPLSGSDLGQLLTAQFQATLRADLARSSTEFLTSVPTIAGFQTRRAIWTSIVADGVPLEATRGDSILISADRHLMTRFLTTKQTLEQANQKLVDADSSAWQKMWLQHIGMLQYQAQRLAGLSTDSSVQRELSPLLGFSPEEFLVEESNDDAPPMLQPDSERWDSISLWQALSSNHAAVTIHEFEEEFRSPSVVRYRKPRSLPVGVWPLALFISCAAAGFVWIMHSGTIVEWAACWPESLGIGAGVLWWLLLRPSVVGVLVAVGCLAIYLSRNLWPILKAMRRELASS